MIPSVKNHRRTILSSQEYPEEKLSLTMNDLLNKIQIEFYTPDMQGQTRAKEVIRSAFQIEAELGTAYRLSHDAINTLQPRMEGALALLHALEAKRSPTTS